MATVLCAGCDDRTEQPASAPTKENLEVDSGFFDPTALEEDTTELGADFGVVPCKNASLEEQATAYHPRLVRGQVVAPFGRLAFREPAPSSPFDWFVAEAHAVPLEGEDVVDGAEVIAYRVSRDGSRGKIVVRTKTDALGRYCIRIPKGTRFGPRLVVEASRDDVRLRRLLPNNLNGNITSQTEAIVQIVEDRNLLDEITTEELINLQTAADTAVDFMHPVKLTPDMDVRAAVDAVRESLETDQRVRKILEEVQ